MTDPTNADLLASDPVVDAVTAALAEEATAKEALEKAEADLAAANALPRRPRRRPPVDRNEAPKPLRTDGPTLEEFVAAGYQADHYPPEGYAPKVVTATEAPVVPVERWRACNGGDISAVLRARSMGLAEFTTRDEVFAFLASKGG